jgi:quinol monooxygenase YgiN
MKKLLVLLIMLANIAVAEAKDMNLTVNIYYTGENGNARKFAEEMEQSGTAAAIRAEKGNLKYEYFYPVNDKETVLLIDSWENQEAIDAHHATPMMNKIMELRNKYDLHMRVERFIEDKTIPEQDQNFIRK